MCIRDRALWGIAAIAFFAIFAFGVPFPIIIGIAAVLGVLVVKTSAPPEATAPAVPIQRTIRTVALWLVIWWAPLLMLLAAPEPFFEIGSFFSRLAVVTFGGAYAVLAYMAQDVVTGFGWLTTGEMMDGLGLAETTPGPLILVTEFVGFLAGEATGGWTFGLFGALVTLWATFVPCFLWIFAGAPYIDWIADRPRLKAALSGITAAVVGVILNLSLWFALHVFFGEVARTDTGPLQLWYPIVTTLNPIAVILAIAAGYLLLVWKWPLVVVLAASALAGAASTLI